VSIDLTIVGDPAGIRGIAEWLSPKLSEPVINADLELAYAVTDSQSYWAGLAGNAFRGAANQVRDRATDLPSFLKDAAEVFRAYADKLDRGQEDFDGYLTQAAAAGLTVTGKTVLPPTSSLTYCPAEGAPAADVAEYDAYLDKVKTYNTLGEYVGTWWAELEVWLTEHMVPLTPRCEALSPIGGLVEGLSVGNEDVVATALEHASVRTDRDLASFRESAQTMQVDADRFSDQLRSGNPALRAAAEAANPRELRAGLETLNETIGNVTKYSKLIPVVGGVIDVVSAGVEISNGASASSTTAGLLAGASGAAVAGWALAGVAIPPLGVALIVGGVAVAAGSAGTWLWEAAVPLDARETIDDFFTGRPPVLYDGPSQATGLATR
jgi:predicted phage tail protein